MLKKIALLVVFAILLNALFIFFDWVNHLLITGLYPYLSTLWIVLSLLITITLVFLAPKSSRYDQAACGINPATLYILGAFVFLISLFAVGKNPHTLDIQVHDTLFVIAHAHVTIFQILIFLFFGLIYFCYPRITGKNLNAPLSYLHFSISLFSAYLIFPPVTYNPGLAGMPRPYTDYSTWGEYFHLYPANNLFGTKMFFLLLFGQLLFIINLIYSAFSHSVASK